MSIESRRVQNREAQRRWRAAHLEERRAYNRQYMRDKRRLDPAYRAYDRADHRLRRHNWMITASLHELACTGPPCACPPVWIIR